MHRLEGMHLRLKMSHHAAPPSFRRVLPLGRRLLSKLQHGDGTSERRGRFFSGKERHLPAVSESGNRRGRRDSRLTAEGEIGLREEEHFPFRFDAQFSNLECVQLDLVTARARRKKSKSKETAALPKRAEPRKLCAPPFNSIPHPAPHPQSASRL